MPTKKINVSELKEAWEQLAKDHEKAKENAVEVNIDLLQFASKYSTKYMFTVLKMLKDAEKRGPEERAKTLEMLKILYGNPDDV